MTPIDISGHLVAGWRHCACQGYGSCLPGCDDNKPRIRLCRDLLSRFVGGMWECFAEPHTSLVGIGLTPQMAYENWSRIWQFRPGNSYRL